jgi:hypothetical protein
LGLPLSRLLWRLLLNTWLLLLPILLTWPIQFNRLFLINESICNIQKVTPKTGREGPRGFRVG